MNRTSSVIILLALVVAGCQDQLAGSPDPISQVKVPTTTLPGIGVDGPVGNGEAELSYETVVDDIVYPVILTARPGEDTSYVATKDGRVWELRSGELREILDISSRVLDNHEQGLLGMTLDPMDRNRLYLHYITGEDNGMSILSTFDFTAQGTLDPESEDVLLTIQQPGKVHNGGMIQFGPRGMLYVGLGDGGGIGDPYENGQNPETLFGSILRLYPGSGGPFAVPDENPFIDAPGSDLVWVYGLRNPWRFWIDYTTETIYIGDVGQALSEEIDIVGLDGGGSNFGWSITEGTHCYGTELEPAESCETDGLIPPVVEVRHGDKGACSITGGVVYRGESIPGLRGHYLYSDYCGGWLRSFLWADSGVTSRRDWTDQVGVAGAVVSFGVDGYGEVYVLTTESILKLVPG